MKKSFLIIIVLSLVIVGGVFVYNKNQSSLSKKDEGNNNSLQDKSKPMVYKDLVEVDNLKAGEKIESPVTIKGKARGTWFFEASFPVFVVDWNGKIIGQGIAKAEGDWMTEDYVPFTAEITFDKSQISGSYSHKGLIILKKDNPSGLPEHDDAFEFPIYFK